MIKMIITLVAIIGMVYTQSLGSDTLQTSVDLSTDLKGQSNQHQYSPSVSLQMNEQSSPQLSISETNEDTSRKLNDQEKTKITVLLVLIILFGFILKKCYSKHDTPTTQGNLTPEACLVSNNQKSPTDWLQTNPEQPPIIIVQNIQSIKQKYLVTQTINKVSLSASSYNNQTVIAVSGTCTQ